MPRVHSAREERFGGYLEDYEPGEVFRHWPGKTVTEAEDHMFCLLTMAASPLHVDRHYAATETEFGKNIVVGTFVYSLLLGMSVPDISGRAIANLGVSELRHVAPLFHGDTLYGETVVRDKRISSSRPTAGIVTLEHTGRNQDGEIVATAVRQVMTLRSPDPTSTDA